MKTKRKSFGENTNIVLFNQVDGICPLCDTPLIYEKSGSKFKKYELAHIYPLNPSLEESRLLHGEERLCDDVDHEDNLIPLCKICHGKFDKPRTVDEYRNLVRIKKELISKSEQQNLWHQYQIENDIEKLVAALYDEDALINTDEIEFEPKEIDRKVDNTMSSLTKRKIKNNVSDYFAFIKNKLLAIEAENPGASDIILLQVRHYYLKQKQKERNQQRIYDNVVEWILKKTNSPSIDAADILASFFVQNCEVLE